MPTDATNALLTVAFTLRPLAIYAARTFVVLAMPMVALLVVPMVPMVSMVVSMVPMVPSVHTILRARLMRGHMCSIRDITLLSGF